MRAAAPMIGLGSAVFGITLIVSNLGDVFKSLAFLNQSTLWIILAGAAVAIVILLIGSKKLVKK